MTPATRFVAATAAVFVVGAVVANQLVLPASSDHASAAGATASASAAAPAVAEGREHVIGRPYLEHHVVRAPIRSGWERLANTLIRRGPSGSEIGISAWRVGWAYADPCRWKHTRVDFVGSFSGPRHVAEALAVQVGREGTEPEGTELGGWGAIRVDLSVPGDINVEACDDGRYIAFAHPDALPGNDNHWAGQRDLVFVVSIDRGPIIVDAWMTHDATDADRAELDAMLESLEVDLAEPRS